MVNVFKVLYFLLTYFSVKFHFRTAHKVLTLRKITSFNAAFSIGGEGVEEGRRVADSVISNP